MELVLLLATGKADKTCSAARGDEGRPLSTCRHVVPIIAGASLYVANVASDTRLILSERFIGFCRVSIGLCAKPGMSVAVDGCQVPRELRRPVEFGKMFGEGLADSQVSPHGSFLLVFWLDAPLSSGTHADYRAHSECHSLSPDTYLEKLVLAWYGYDYQTASWGCYSDAETSAVQISSAIQTTGHLEIMSSFSADPRC